MAGNPLAPPPTLSGKEERASYPCQWYASAGAYYCHQDETWELPSSKKAHALGANFIVDDPPEEANEHDPGEHSLTQLWAINRTHNSDVEFGYGASPAVFGDVYSHLFVSYEDGGTYPYPYNPPSPEWIGNSESPYAPGNIVSTPGQLSEAYFAVERYSNGKGGYNWWFYINGYYMGYMPQSAWTHYFPATDTELALGGEVASPYKGEPCIWMGTGSKGQELSSANINHAKTVYTNNEGVEFSSYVVPNYYGEEGYSNYNEGNTEPNTGTVHYGGKGWNTGFCP